MDFPIAKSGNFAPTHMKTGQIVKTSRLWVSILRIMDSKGANFTDFYSLEHQISSFSRENLVQSKITQFFTRKCFQLYVCFQLLTRDIEKMTFPESRL